MKLTSKFHASMSCPNFYCECQLLSRWSSWISQHYQTTFTCALRISRLLSRPYLSTSALLWETEDVKERFKMCENEESIVFGTIHCYENKIVEGDVWNWVQTDTTNIGWTRMGQTWHDTCWQTYLHDERRQDEQVELEQEQAEQRRVLEE